MLVGSVKMEVSITRQGCIYLYKVKINHQGYEVVEYGDNPYIYKTIDRIPDCGIICFYKTGGRAFEAHFERARSENETLETINTFIQNITQIFKEQLPKMDEMKLAELVMQFFRLIITGKQHVLRDF
jgi:hypothetical protein